MFALRLLAAGLVLSLLALAGSAAGAQGAARGGEALRVGAPDGRAAVDRPAPRPRRLRRAAAGDDPRLAEQWALDGDAAMGARSAWRQSTGGDVVVAVVDSGADLDHPELAPNLWRNPGEVPGNGVDDDRNGVVDDVHGVDLVDDDGDPADRNGHGTHVAGTVAARGGNGIGVAGVAWRARIMPVRVLDHRAAGLTSTVAAGVRYAVAHGARIVNLSLAGPGRSAELEAALAEAQARGVLVVAAAGNEGRDLAAHPSYPASFGLENVIGVAATTPDGRLADVSAFGAGVDIAAPGEDILSTALGGRYEWRTGTSMAAPHVTGTLALLAAVRPELDWRGLRDAVLGGARPSALPVGAGSLDAAGALGLASPSLAGDVVVDATPAGATGRGGAKGRAGARSPRSTKAGAKAKAKARAKAKRLKRSTRRAKARRAARRSSRRTAKTSAARRAGARRAAR